MNQKEEKYLQWLKERHVSRLLLPNQLDEAGLSQMHHCAYRGYLSCLKWLAKHGGNLAASSGEGSVAAHYAAAGGHLDTLQWIYRRSSRTIGIKDHNGATPLYFAAQEGHFDCLEWLAKRSATVHNQVSIDGMTAAHASAQEGHLECLQFLIMSAGCSGLARDKSGCTPMHFAAAGGHRSCVHWLSAHGWGSGSERNKSGSSPLHVAAEHGHLEVVKLLMKAGAKADLYDRSGRTAYDIAVETGNEACAQFLLQATHKTLNGLLDNIFAHQSSLKRVRFERKAIEKGIRDSNPELDYSFPINPYIGESRQVVRGKRTRSRSFAHPSREEYMMSRSLDTRSYSSESLTNHLDLSKYLSNFDVSYTPVIEASSANSYLNSAAHVPQTHERLRRTTSAPVQTDERPKPRVFRSQTWRGESDRGARSDWATSRGHSYRISNSSQQYEVSSNPASNRPNVTTLLSAWKNRRWREKEKPAREVYDPKDLIPFSAAGPNPAENIFRRLYRLSKKKLSRTSSFAVQGTVNRSEPTRHADINRESFFVSGHDDFMSGYPETQGAMSYHPVEAEQPTAAAYVQRSPRGSPSRGSREGTAGHEGQIVKYGSSKRSDFKLENIRINLRDNALIW